MRNKFHLEFRVCRKHSSRFFGNFYSVSGVREKVKSSVFFILQTCRYTYTDICAYVKEMMSSRLSSSPELPHLDTPCDVTSSVTTSPMISFTFTRFQLLSFGTCVYMIYSRTATAPVRWQQSLDPPKPLGASWKKNPIFVGVF